MRFMSKYRQSQGSRDPEADPGPQFPQTESGTPCSPAHASVYGRSSFQIRVPDAQAVIVGGDFKDGKAPTQYPLPGTAAAHKIKDVR